MTQPKPAIPARLFASSILILLVACQGPNGDAVDSSPTPLERTADGRLSPAMLQADFDSLYATLKAAHFDLFALSSPADWEARFEAIRAQLDQPLTLAEAEVLFQRFAATANMGHTRIESSDAAFAEYQADGGRTVPFFVRVIDDTVWITEAYDPTGGLKRGDELIAIDGEPIATWLERLAAHVSAETPYFAHSLLEFWFPRLMWIEVGPVETLLVERRRSGEIGTTEVAVATRTEDEMRELRATAPPALSLDWTGRSFRQLDDDVGYLRPGPFYDAENPNPFDPSGFERFIDQAFDELIAGGTRDLILDLRDNPGGDNSFSDLMVAWFADRPFRFASRFSIRVSDQTTASNQKRLDGAPPGSVSHRFAELYAGRQPGELVDFEIDHAEPRSGERFTGNVYALINRHSFSNAASVAATIQDYGFGLILGEPTADMATSYGAMEHFELPLSGIRVGYPKAKIVRPNGDATVHGVVPDLPIETPLLQGPDDPVLQRAVEAVLERRD